MKLERSRIILTGAASGIGAAVLKQLAGIPCQVLASDLREAALETTVRRLVSPAATIHRLAGDIGDPATVDALLDYADAHMGGCDIYIANAGFAYYETFGSADYRHIESIFRVNTLSPLYALAQMKGRHADGSPFLVAVTASAMGRVGMPGYSLYSATKGALVRFADAYRQEAGDDAHFMLINPIATRTNFFHSSRKGDAPVPKPSQTADYVATAILRGIERDAKEVNPSRIFNLTMVVNRVLPVMAIYRAYTRRQYRNWLERTGG